MNSVNDARIGDWIQTYTGRQFWPLDPREDEIDIEDIAHALSMTCRFTGHCKWFYSVAEHSILVMNKMTKINRNVGLLHDASEAYITDVSRPVKRNLPEYKLIEERLMGVIASKYEFIWPPSDELKVVDNNTLLTEAKHLMNEPPVLWSIDGEVYEDVTINCWIPVEAKMRFLEAYEDLYGKVG